MYREKLKTGVLFPLEHGNHPKLENYEILDEEEVEQYQSLN